MVPFQYRNSKRPEGSLYQSAGTAGAVRSAGCDTAGCDTAGCTVGITWVGVLDGVTDAGVGDTGAAVAVAPDAAAQPPDSATGSTGVDIVAATALGDEADDEADGEFDDSAPRSRKATMSVPADRMVTTVQPSADIDESRSASDACSLAETWTDR